MTKIHLVPVDKIKPDPNQPRQIKPSDKEIKTWAEGMREDGGVINPIEIDKNNMIITGECRWRGAKALGLKEIEAKILDMPIKERRTRQRRENNVFPMDIRDKAQSVLDERDEIGQGKPKSPQEKRELIINVAKRLGMSSAWVDDLIYISEKAPKPIREGFWEGKFKPGIITGTRFRKLQEIEGTYGKVRRRVARKIVRDKMTQHSASPMINAILKYPNRIDDIIAVDYNKGTASYVRELDEVISPKKKEAKRPKDQIETQLDGIKAVGRLKENTADVITDIDKIDFGEGNKNIIKGHFADIVGLFNDYTTRRLEPLEEVKKLDI